RKGSAGSCRGRNGLTPRWPALVSSPTHALIEFSVLDDSSIRTRRSPLPPGEGLGGEAGISRTMVRAGRTASACMPMRALQGRDERVMKLGTLDRSKLAFNERRLFLFGMMYAVR